MDRREGAHTTGPVRLPIRPPRQGHPQPVHRRLQPVAQGPARATRRHNARGGNAAHSELTVRTVFSMSLTFLSSVITSQVWWHEHFHTTQEHKLTQCVYAASTTLKTRPSCVAASRSPTPSSARLRPSTQQTMSTSRRCKTCCLCRTPNWSRYSPRSCSTCTEARAWTCTGATA